MIDAQTVQDLGLPEYGRTECQECGHEAVQLESGGARVVWCADGHVLVATKEMLQETGRAKLVHDFVEDR